MDQEKIIFLFFPLLQRSPKGFLIRFFFREKRDDDVHPSNRFLLITVVLLTFLSLDSDSPERFLISSIFFREKRDIIVSYRVHG